MKLYLFYNVPQFDKYLFMFFNVNLMKSTKT